MYTLTQVLGLPDLLATVLANPANVADVCTHSRRCLDSLTSCLQSCVTTSNAKVQWMACTAVHALFTNTQLLVYTLTQVLGLPDLLPPILRDHW